MYKGELILKYKKLSVCMAVIASVQFSLLGLGSLDFTNLRASSNIVHAASINLGQNANEKVIVQKAVMDVGKVWNITFNSEIDYNAVKNSIQVNEVNNGTIGSTVPVIVLAGNPNSVRINPPSGGYKKGQIYQITIKKGIQSKKNKKLLKSNTMKFSINDKNTAIANIQTSPVLNMFKAITINAITRSDIMKYKVEGNDKLFNIGETSINVLNNKSSVKVYFYGTDVNTAIATTTLDVSKNASDITLQVQ